jgi:hypothetical protein
VAVRTDVVILALIAGLRTLVCQGPLPGASTSTPPQAACPDDASKVVRALLTADTLGVGLSADSRDSSQIDSLTTGRFQGAPDEASVVTGFRLSCLFAATDSVIMRLEARVAGTITWDTTGRRYYKIFVADSRISVGYPEVVKRAGGWKVVGPWAATDVSPATALAQFTTLTEESRRALRRLLGRRSPAARRGL